MKENKIAESQDTSLSDKELSVCYEEVDEIMGEIPNCIMRKWVILMFIVVIMLVSGILYIRVPDYIEVDYVVKGIYPSIDIIALQNGKVYYTKTGGFVDSGDTIAVVVDNGEKNYYIAQSKGLLENNLFYSSGDEILNGDTLCRLQTSRGLRPEIFIYIPSSVISQITFDTNVKLYNGSDYIEGCVSDISQIPNKYGFYLAKIQTSSNFANLIPQGRCKLNLKSYRLIEQLWKRNTVPL